MGDKVRKKKGLDPKPPKVQGPITSMALHTLGWKAFQDLCSHVCSEILKCPVEIYREAQDGGQDATFVSKNSGGGRKSEISTIQCKFTSKPDRRIKPSDLKDEEAHIVELVSIGQAKTYVLMTNMGLDAPVAIRIKAWLRTLGVEHPHVLGNEFLTRAIRNSNHLRALVPRVYGLGDLSMILDEREEMQTRAVLGHMLPTLKVYVPTDAHVQAVRTLKEHGIVLLLGDPATGKSTIAAILATTESDGGAHECFRSDGPETLLEHWNPNEPRRFFWLDDAFGPNQLRADFVDRWIAMMPKVSAAIAAGNRIVLTSRRHIYEAAKPKLGSRNHPLLRDGRAVVDVGQLSHQERRQILYNHLKAGSQSKYWKTEVKKHLELLAAEDAFLPEIARRLADPAYTKSLSVGKDDLLKFVREPKEHLLQTIEELSKAHRAALCLIFLHRGKMPEGNASPKMQALVLKHFSLDSDALGTAISELKDSFLVKSNINKVSSWVFKHPTISDAISAILGSTEGMCELYLLGTKAETLLTEVTCVGGVQIADAVIVPTSLEDLLIERLAELPDQEEVNRLFFWFLTARATPSVFCGYLSKNPSFFSRDMGYWWGDANGNGKVLTYARANIHRLLPEERREEIEEYLERVLFDKPDTSFLDDDAILRLISPTKLLKYPSRIKSEVVPLLKDAVQEIEDDANLDLMPDDHYYEFERELRKVEEVFEQDEEGKGLIADIKVLISKAKERIRVRTDERDEEEVERKGSGWTNTLPAASNEISSGGRSIFSDVEE